MKTKNAKELASIISLLLSKDYESVMLGISLFSNHYLITNYPKNKKFQVSLKYKGHRAPSEYCQTYSLSTVEFNKNQFLRMLSSKSVNIRKKTCAIISFIYDNINPDYFTKRRHVIKNPNYNYCLSDMLHYSSLDKFSVDEIKPCVRHTNRITEKPISKKKIRHLFSIGGYLSNQTNYLKISEGLLADYSDCNIDCRLSNNSTPWDIVWEYKQYLNHRFANRGKHVINLIKN